MKNSLIKINFTIVLLSLFALFACGKGNQIKINVVGLKVNTASKMLKVSEPNYQGTIIPDALVILQLNGANDLSINGDGVYAFEKKLSDGDAYVISFALSPYWQTCVLESYSGVMHGSVLINMNCSDKSWSHPSGLDDAISPAGSNADNPQVAIDEQGNAIIVWEQYDGTEDQIFMSQFVNNTWTHPSSQFDNISPGSTRARRPHVSMDNNGNAIIVWAQDREGNYRIYKSEYHNSIWTHPADLTEQINPTDPYGTASTNLPRVAMSDGLTSVIVWLQFVGANQIFESHFRNGEWTHPVDTDDYLSPSSANNANVPKVIIDSFGNSLVAWSQHSNGFDRIFRAEYGELFVGLLQWSVPTDENDFLLPYESTDANAPEIAMDDDGNAIITWYQEDSSGDTQVFLSEFRDWTWDDPDSLADNITGTIGGAGEVARYPQVAMDDNGNAIVTWAQQSGSTVYQTYIKEYRNDTWQNASGISVSTKSVFYPKVAMDNNDQAVVVWDQKDAFDTPQIYMSIYREGYWNHPDDIYDNISIDGKACEDPQVVMSKNGDIIIVWTQFDSSNNTRIYMSHYR